MKKESVACDQCQLPCEEGVFDVTVSAASWPAKSTLKIADCDEEDVEAIAAGGCLNLYRNNGAMVEVFYEQLNYQLLDEAPAYEFVNLASDFGGQIGLWLGLSALSIIEFFVLLGQVCHFCCSSRRPSSKTYPNQRSISSASAAAPADSAPVERITSPCPEK